MSPVGRPELEERIRLHQVAQLFALLVLAVLLRLIWVQGLRADTYENPNGTNYHRRFVLPAEKGELLDRQERPLARCVQVASVSANPQLIADPARVAEQLAALLPVPQTELLRHVRSRWRRIMLRREVPAAAEAAVAGLVARGIVSFSDEPAEPSFSCYVFPRQFQPAPSERRHLALILGCQAADLEALLGSEAGVLRCADGLDAATAKRLDQLGLTGLLVQQNPLRLARAAWLEPVSAALHESPADPTRPGPRGADWVVHLDEVVWNDLGPLWDGVERPAKEILEARLRAPFVFLARELPLELGEAVEARVRQAKLEGVSVHREYRREYPQGPVARLLLGRTDVDERGLTGLEALYNQILTGVDGYRRVTVSALGTPIVQEHEERVPPVHGKNVELTLDAVIQGYAEEVLASTVRTFDADWALAVIADPSTGEILAMADVASASRHVPNMSRCMVLAYEPGSVIKPLVVAAATQDHVTTPRELFYCGGKVGLGDRTIQCLAAHGPETVADAVRDSCNITMTQIGARMGQAGLEPWFRRYGMLGRTGLGLEGQEASGAIFAGRPDGRWDALKVATVSFGKGIQCSAVGLVRAYSAIINGGTLPALRLVRRIRDRDGRVVVEQPLERGPRILSEQTAVEVRAMLRAVVADPHGTGQRAKSTLYDLAGKTGTSTGYRADDPRVVSFIGFAPYGRPRLVCLVSVGEPRVGKRQGGVTCGPAVREILERSLEYLGVPPKSARGGGHDAR